jgi:hypothetical protein
LPPFVICAASQVEAGKVQGMDKEYTCILEVAPVEMEFAQVENTHYDYWDFFLIFFKI